MTDPKPNPYQCAWCGKTFLVPLLARLCEETHKLTNRTGDGFAAPTAVPAPATPTTTLHAAVGGTGGRKMATLTEPHPIDGDFVRITPAGATHIAKGTARWHEHWLVETVCGKRWSLQLVERTGHEDDDPQRPCAKCWEAM
ncbi:MAG: hypothetical protein ACXV2H_09290 [Actinomycetes bacterium]